MCQQIFRNCPNVKKLTLPDILDDIPEEKEILPNIEFIRKCFRIYSQDVYKLQILSEKYSKTMKIIVVGLYHLTEQELKTCIEYIARFENLQSLTLYLDNFETTEPFDDCLSLIGQKCTKLLDLDLRIDKRLPITKNFFHIFKKFKAIKKLGIDLPHNRVLSGSVECFKHCKQLNELKMTYPKLTQQFLANINIFFPKLQTLVITTDQHFTKAFINSLQLIKNLKTINIQAFPSISVFMYKSRRFAEPLTESKCEFMDSIVVNDYC